MIVEEEYRRYSNDAVMPTAIGVLSFFKIAQFDRRREPERTIVTVFHSNTRSIVCVEQGIGVSSFCNCERSTRSTSISHVLRHRESDMQLEKFDVSLRVVYLRREIVLVVEILGLSTCRNTDLSGDSFAWVFCIHAFDRVEAS